MRAGQRVGKYVLGEQIGRGGMAEVWAAHAEGPGGFVKPVALKFIAESFTGDVDLERLFLNEARLAAQLQHANLVGVFDFDKWVSEDHEAGEGANPGRYYIAMERVEGQDLRRLLQVARHRGHRLPATVALHIAGEVGKGLRYVHERRDNQARPLGLVHRDVSPHNVLIGMGGEVKLSDFGIAKAMSQSLGTQAGTVRGKLAYASPEQLSGAPVDHRADQFALGVTLWEMLADRRLFEGADEGEIVGKVLRCEIPPLCGSAAAPLEPAVADIVRRMLARSPSDRFPTTAAAVAEILAAPGYVPHASALVDLMRALFASPRPVVPPTVPMRVSPPPAAPGPLAETSEMAPATLVDGGRDGMGEGTAATGSGYVSADTPPVPSWVDQSVIEPHPRRLARLVAITVVAGVAVAAGITAARRLSRTKPDAAAAVSAKAAPPVEKTAPGVAGRVPGPGVANPGLPRGRVAPSRRAVRDGTPVLTPAPPLELPPPSTLPPETSAPAASADGRGPRRSGRSRAPLGPHRGATVGGVPRVEETGPSRPANAGLRGTPAEEGPPAHSSTGSGRRETASNGAPILE